MVQNYRSLVHYTVQIIKSLQFITESLDLTPISHIANQYTPPIRITSLREPTIQNSAHTEDVPRLPAQLASAARQKARRLLRERRAWGQRSQGLGLHDPSWRRGWTDRGAARPGSWLAREMRAAGRPQASAANQLGKQVPATSWSVSHTGNFKRRKRKGPTGL